MTEPRAEFRWELAGQGWAKCTMTIGARAWTWKCSWCAGLSPMPIDDDVPGRPNDTARAFVYAMRTLLEGADRAIVQIDEEGARVDLNFWRVGDDKATLTVKVWDDSYYAQNAGPNRIEGPFDLPLIDMAWQVERAFARLERDEAGYNASWSWGANTEFPGEDLARLRAALATSPAGP